MSMNCMLRPISNLSEGLWWGMPDLQRIRGFISLNILFAIRPELEDEHLQWEMRDEYYPSLARVSRIHYGAASVPSVRHQGSRSCRFPEPGRLVQNHASGRASAAVCSSSSRLRSNPSALAVATRPRTDLDILLASF